MFILSHIIKFKIVIILCFITLSSIAQNLETVVANDKFRLILPENINPNDLKTIEWSTNLIDWEPVARNFGYQWQNTFPNAETIETINGNDQYYEKDLDESSIFYRLSTNTFSNIDNSHSISRFLQQATFGPKLSEIQAFDGYNASDLDDSPYTYYSTWIANQINTNLTPISSHRAYFRERSDPSFVTNPSAIENGVSLFEVGTNENYELVFDYYEQGNDLQPDPDGMPNNQGTVYEFETAQNGNWTYDIERSRYDAWQAKGLTSNPNDPNFNVKDIKQIIWHKIAIDGVDQLRQRMAWALSQILVVGLDGNIHPQNNEKWLVYYDIFVRHAFGNYRDILDEVTYSPHMAYYLTYEGNKLQDGDKFPDENYAREVMQLFTIGLWELNQNGTFKRDTDENLIPTYDNQDITEFAKVFTGLSRPLNYGGTNFEAQFGRDYISRVRIESYNHDFGPKTNLYGTVFEHTTVTNDVNYVLDHLFNHDNTPPFIAKRLIQRFTVSNPSPTYIYDVAQAFIDGSYNGYGTSERGCLEAVIRAILLHPEARTQSLGADVTHGKLREPYTRLMHYCRSFNLTSLNTWGLYNIRDLLDSIGQAPYNSPSVFNFYKSDYQPMGDIIDKNLVAPEFEIFTDVTSVQLPNVLWWLIYEGIRRNSEDTGLGNKWYSQGVLDLSDQISLLQNDVDDLIDNLDLLITAGRLTDQNRAIIKNYLNNSSGNAEQKVKDALYLFCILPEFNSLY